MAETKGAVTAGAMWGDVPRSKPDSKLDRDPKAPVDAHHLDAYVDAYVARTGLDPRPHLAVYFAYNFFRISAILQGIAGRVRDGTATSAYAAAKAELVRPLAATAWEFAVKAGA